MNIDNFLKACFGISLVILSTAGLIFSLQPASADTPQQNRATGKYQSSSQYVKNDGKMYFSVYITNTETGEGALYHWQTGGSFTKLSKFAMPADPI